MRAAREKYTRKMAEKRKPPKPVVRAGSLKDLARRRDHSWEAPRCRWVVCSSSHPARVTWDLVLFALLLYVAFAIPYRVGFGVEPRGGWLA